MTTSDLVRISEKKTIDLSMSSNHRLNNGHSNIHDTKMRLQFSVAFRFGEFKAKAASTFISCLQKKFQVFHFPAIGT